MNVKPLLKLVVVTNIFLLFAIVVLPALIRYLQQPFGRFVYSLLAAVCIILALLLRRTLSELD